MNVAYGMYRELCTDRDEREAFDARCWPDVDADESGHVESGEERARRMVEAFGGDGEVVMV